MSKIKVQRGIEKGTGDKKVRFEAGESVDREKLEKQFSKKAVAHWLKTGVLKAGKGGADGR